MPTAVVLITLYILLPIIWGTKKHYSTPKNYKTLIRQLSPLTKKLKNLDTETIISIIFWIATSLLYIFVFLQAKGVTQSKFFGRSLLFFCSATPLLLFIIKFKILLFIRSNYSWLKWTAGVIGVIVTIFASVYADEMIVKATHSRAENFPAAQRVLIVANSLLAYYYLMIFTILTVCAFQMFYIFFKEMIRDKYLSKYIRAWNIILQKKPSKAHYKKANFSDLSLVVGLLLCSTGMIKLGEIHLNENSLNTNIQRIIIFSSFHARPEDCDMEYSDRIFVAILPFDKMVTATRTENGTYDFKSGRCQR
ncbi:hypothetical protein [Pseudomonas lijiangensis]|uniref:Uncharacterized protein n=1 Tax=Pseudomonas lijiangensis TaxID=2995658 RepID=A0ABX8HMF4_9PSED|nr:hypothetical protein [Pseudomonas lijiangensis]MBX8500004.1 hypothetical protein [Pseudomonas lijiangensis]MBX8503761.1 hypothetical protein [Pseudomonas lijiangensis]QWU81841.1 hypothetical protein KQP88_17545 [Pseudomonas lijiangensis]